MSENTKTTAKKPGQTSSDTPAKPRRKVKSERRNRSTKRRPTDVPGLITALNTSALDQRTVAARDILAMRDALAENPEAVIKGLVRDALAVDGVIMGRIAAELVRPDSSILDANGEPHPLIVKHWPEARNGILKTGKTLLDLERSGTPGTPGGDSSEVDISTIILEAQREEGKA